LKRKIERQFVMRQFRYLQSFVDRKTGTVFHYFRRAGFPRVRLPGLPGSHEFNDAYAAALDQPNAPIGLSRSKSGSVAAAVAAYFVSPQFNELATGTKAARRAVLQRFRDEHGELSIATMPPKFIALMLRKKTPHAARNWMKAIRGLCQFAVAVEMIEADPTREAKLPKAKSTPRRAWTDREIEQYEDTYPIGSMPRLAFALGLYTIQRAGDVIKLGRQHIHNGVLNLRQSKTGIALTLPIRPELQRIIDATPSGQMTFLVTDTGRQWRNTYFSDQFRQWCNEAGLPRECTFHGLRATGCTILADASCSIHEIAAWSGHLTLKEVERYTRGANQRQLAISALARSTGAH
jgi:integrase